jgi:TATA-binding protein-associated factor
VIVPVRETVAQTLGVLMQFCDKELCIATSQALLMLVGQGGWEVRHAGLIGLKYWMGVRTDLVGDVLVDEAGGETGIFKAIIVGLGDNDDDVRAVSSTTLLPVTGILMDLLKAERVYQGIVVLLWDCLNVLDDLTSATTSGLSSWLIV